MAFSISAAPKSVAELLSDGSRLRLPFYQRGYAWQEEHVERLINDLLRVIDGETSLDWYPLGTIIMRREAADGTAELADGHQRLLSLSLIISILRDRETDPTRKARLQACIRGTSTGDADADDYPYRLRTLDGDRTLLVDFVLADGATLMPLSPTLKLVGSGAQCIIANRAWLTTCIDAMPPERQRKLADLVLDRCPLVVIEVEDATAALMLFRTTHDTGLKINDVDLLKARVLGVLEENGFDDGQSAWEAVEARAGKGRLEPLLRSIATIEDGSFPRQGPALALSRRLDVPEPLEAAIEILRQFNDLGARYCDILTAGGAPGDIPPPLARRFQYLGWVNRHDTWLVPALAWLQRYDLADPDTLTFFRRLEALAWVQMIRAEDVARRDRRYLELTSAIPQGRALADGSMLYVDRAERQAVRRLLAEPGLTRKPYRTFLLLRLNSLAEATDRIAPPAPATIEHIFPHRPGLRSNWQGIFGRGEEATRLKSLLGNLTLLSQHDQNIADNAEFAVKRAVYERSSFALTRQVAAYPDWRPEDVVSRTSSLIDGLLADWGLAEGAITSV